MSELTPAELVAQVEQLVEANAALHTFNQQLLVVFRAADKMLNSRLDDLAARVALGKSIDNCKAAFEAIREGKVEALPVKQGEEDGTIGNGETVDGDTDGGTVGRTESDPVERSDGDDGDSRSAEREDVDGERQRPTSGARDAVSSVDRT